MREDYLAHAQQCITTAKKILFASLGCIVANLGFLGLWFWLHSHYPPCR